MAFFLNLVGAALWDALQWEVSVDELTDLLLEVNPDQDKDALSKQISDVLSTLMAAGLVKPA